MSELHFDRMPPMGLHRAVLGRKPGLKAGQQVPPLSAEVRGVDASGVEPYARLCGFPTFDPLPLTWPQVLAGPLHLAMFTHRSTPIPALGMVHVFSRIEQRAPLPRRQPLDLRCAWAEQRPAKQGVELDLVTEATVDGAVAWRSVTTVLSRAAPKDPELPGRGDGAPPEALSRSVGWRLGGDLGRRYASVSGDYNPIHLYPVTAKLFGFQRHIIHGMWTLARALAELHDELPREEVSVECTFRRPVTLPNSVLFSSGPQGQGLGFRVTSPGSGKVRLWGVVG
ncbi:MAG: hypothetical protein H6739_27485 [Alphaproteobacteria bacterium]|nr:hypothetical protein [Alphaproteobacteria bacterium]